MEEKNKQDEVMKNRGGEVEVLEHLPVKLIKDTVVKLMRCPDSLLYKELFERASQMKISEFKTIIVEFYGENLKCATSKSEYERLIEEARYADKMSLMECDTETIVKELYKDKNKLFNRLLLENRAVYKTKDNYVVIYNDNPRRMVYYLDEDVII